jgi:REP element-mobilizing transposase RayT
MVKRNIEFIKGEYYHIYNRGCNKEDIFYKPTNYSYLMGLMEKCLEPFQVSTIAFCLMLNHYHFLLRQNSDISIRNFIQSVFNSYTKAFNKMFDRTGTLFEGPFKAIHIDNQSYLIHLCRYIHRNPLDAGLVEKLNDWKYSNYLGWIGQRNSRLIDFEFVKNSFRNPEDYINFVSDYISPKTFDSELKKYIGKISDSL